MRYASVLTYVIFVLFLYLQPGRAKLPSPVIPRQDLWHPWYSECDSALWHGLIAKSLSFWLGIVSDIIDIGSPNSLIHLVSVPRVVGTDAHEGVLKIITDKLIELDWNVFLDSFYSRTVIGRKKFTNIIAVDNINASSYLVLSAHYDSKWLPFRFEGASDSAASCCIILALAKLLKVLGLSPNDTIGIILIFFDGEEAFINWTEEDSLYGSRHLSEIFAINSTLINEKNLSVLYSTQGGNNRPTTSSAFLLGSISLMVTLDLLGTIDHSPVSYFVGNSFEDYAKLHRITEQLKKYFPAKTELMSGKSSAFGLVEDDHLPFLMRGVNVLHLIPAMYPKQWHTAEDTIKNLDNDGIAHWTISLFLFILEKIAN